MKKPSVNLGLFTLTKEVKKLYSKIQILLLNLRMNKANELDVISLQLILKFRFQKCCLKFYWHHESSNAMILPL